MVLNSVFWVISSSTEDYTTVPNNITNSQDMKIPIFSAVFGKLSCILQANGFGEKGLCFPHKLIMQRGLDINTWIVLTEYFVLSPLSMKNKK